jgi:branched-chain amino acid transport system permease protein
VSAEPRLRAARLRGRPELRVSYTRDQAIFNTPAKRAWFGVLLVVAVIAPFWLSLDWVHLYSLVFAASIGAIGLNIISGYTGQISLGHAFFLGIGAYTGIVISAPTGQRLLGLGIDNVLVWLPAAGLVAALIGVAVAPIATRLRGLYLAIVTLGLVFLGEHIFREAVSVTGGVGTGRSGPRPTLFGFEFHASGEVFGIMLARQQRMYFLGLACLILFGFLAKNLVRSDVGRAFAAVRDRDIAAEIMGVNLNTTKLLAFGVSSFYAGVAGALTATFVGFVEPAGYNLLLSILYIAMVIIGGVATISGSIMGAAFITLLPRFVQELPHYVPLVSPRPFGPWPNIFHIERMLYGLFIILFVILEPRGLYGLWVRVRNYFKAWPFSY